MSKGIKRPLIVEMAAFLVALFSFIFAVRKYFSKKEVKSSKKKIGKRKK